jgi:hypothetical protein
MSRYVTLSAAVLCLLVAGCVPGSSRPPGAFDGQAKALKDPDPAVRRQAARELAVAGKSKETSNDILRTLPELEEGVKDEDRQTRFWCAIALVQVPVGRIPAPVNPATREVLADALKDEDPEIRQAAAEALKKAPAGDGRRPPTPPGTASGKEPSATGREPPGTGKEPPGTGKEPPATGRAAGTSEKE